MQPYRSSTEDYEVSKASLKSKESKQSESKKSQREIAKEKIEEFVEAQQRRRDRLDPKMRESAREMRLKTQKEMKEQREGLQQSSQTYSETVAHLEPSDKSVTSEVKTEDKPAKEQQTDAPLDKQSTQEETAEKLQAAARGYLAREEAHEAKEKEAATDIQRLFRGHLGRKEAKRERTEQAKEIGQILKRVAFVTKAEQHKLSLDEYMSQLSPETRQQVRQIAQIPKEEREKILQSPPLQQLAELQRRGIKFTSNQIMRYLLNPATKDEFREEVLLSTGSMSFIKGDWKKFSAAKQARNQLNSLETTLQDLEPELEDIASSGRKTAILDKLKIVETQSSIEELANLADQYAEDTDRLYELAKKYKIEYDESKDPHALNGEIRDKLRETRKTLESTLEDLEKRVGQITISDEERTQLQDELNKITAKEERAQEIRNKILECKQTIAKAESTHAVLIQEMEKTFAEAQTPEEKAVVLKFATSLIERGIFPKQAFEHGIFRQANMPGIIQEAEQANHEQLKEIATQFQNAREPSQELHQHAIGHNDTSITTQFEALAKGNLKGEERKKFIEEFAQTITTRCGDIFNDILPIEFAGQAWTKPELDSPHVRKISAIFNELSASFISQILMANNINEAFQAYAASIEIAHQLLKMGNLHSAYAFIAAFNSSPILRLKFEEFLPTKLQQKQSELEELFDAKGNFKNLRQYVAKLEAQGKTYIPPIAPFLTDLTFIDDGNPDLIEDKFPNLEKANLAVGVLRLIHSAQDKEKTTTTAPYDFDEFLSSTRKYKDDDSAYARSQELRPSPKTEKENNKTYNYTYEIVKKRHGLKAKLEVVEKKKEVKANVSE